MKEPKIRWSRMTPVLFSFVIMGFVDIIGVAIGYIQQDFGLKNFAVQFLPMMVLLWFFVLAVPAGILQDKIGKRSMLTAGMFIQACGLAIPFIYYSFGIMFASFLLLGIGNTIIQVSTNPLLQDISPKGKLASFMSTGQFIKAVISFSGPIIATWFAVHFGNWKLVFALYGITSVLAAVWLILTPIAESLHNNNPATFKSAFRLLKDRFVAVMAGSIFLLVGAEVALNTNIAPILMAKFNLPMESVAIGISIFFAGETIARLAGAIVLNWVKPRWFLLLVSLVALIGVSGILLSTTYLMGLVFIFITGLGAGNMFPVIFSLALEKMPHRANEISGLLTMAISGGAVIPPVAGFLSTIVSPVSGLFVIAFCLLFILWVSFYVRRN